MGYMLKKYVPLLVIAGIALVVYFLGFNDESSPEKIEIDSVVAYEEIELNSNLEAKETVEVFTIIVDVKGAVKKPGVYEIDADARVHHVIELAGGFVEKADENQINLAQKVQDEMVLYVPFEGEEETSVSGTISSHVVLPNDSGKIQVNVATINELTTLNGIGPKKAEAIIAFREENGPFTQIEDLLQVSGIGEKTLENIRDDIIIP